MIGDRDRSAYGIALASIGLAFAVLLAGICWIATQHGDIAVLHERGCALEIPIHCRPESWSTTIAQAPDIPPELWIVLAGLGGLFAGTLIPFPLPPRRSNMDASGGRLPRIDRNLFRISIALFIAGAAAAIISIGASAAGFALSGLLLGLLVPFPARDD